MRRLLWLGVFVSAGLIGGCAALKTPVDENLLGADYGDGDRVPVIVTCNSELDNFAAAVEARYPDIQLIQECYTGEYRVNEHIAHIQHNDFGDIIMVKAGQIPKIDMSEHLLDLSTRDFPAYFNVSALQPDENGRIRLIPGPLSFNCNIYNKTLFEENNWAVPNSYEEFMALSQEIDKTGIRGNQRTYYDSSLQSQTVYNYCVFSALDTLTEVEGQIWHNKLMAGEKVSLEPMETAFEDMRRMMEAGMIRAEDLELTRSMRIDALLDRKIAVSDGEIDHLKSLNSQGMDEFSFMPHFSMTDGQGWLLNLGFYFGVNKGVKQPGNEQKLEAVMEIMAFIASEEGQNFLIQDELGMVPATRGAGVPDDPTLKGIEKLIESGRYIMRPGYDMFSSVLDTEIAAFIRGETDSQTILDKCSTVLEEGALPRSILGQSEKDFTVLQTGCLKADAMRHAVGADIALMGVSEVNGYDPVGGTRAKLYQGGITEADITRIAQIKMESPLICSSAVVTGKELLGILEHGAASEAEMEIGDVSHFHPFAVSGLQLSYDMDSEEGRRVSGVKLADGSSLNPDAFYTVTFVNGALPADKVSGTETGVTVTDALRDYAAVKKRVAPDEKRITFK